MKLAIALAAVTAVCLAPVAFDAITRRFREAQATIVAEDAPRPVEEWDIYSVTYKLHDDAPDERPMSDLFAAESAGAATKAVLDRSPGALIAAVINITGEPIETQDGAA